MSKFFENDYYTLRIFYKSGCMQRMSYQRDDMQMKKSTRMKIEMRYQPLTNSKDLVESIWPLFA